jgi:hypothetical protein
VSISGLHERLYPREFYDPVTSRVRLHQNLMRLRRWLEDSGVPVEIDESDGFYRLSGLGVLRIRHLAAPVSAVVRKRTLALSRRFGVSEFAIGGAADAWGVSTRSANRFLKGCVQSGLVRVEGRGNGTRYRLGSTESSR